MAWGYGWTEMLRGLVERALAGGIIGLMTGALLILLTPKHRRLRQRAIAR